VFSNRTVFPTISAKRVPLLLVVPEVNSKLSKSSKYPEPPVKTTYKSELLELPVILAVNSCILFQPPVPETFTVANKLPPVALPFLNSIAPPLVLLEAVTVMEVAPE